MSEFVINNSINASKWNQIITFLVSKIKLAWKWAKKGTLKIPILVLNQSLSDFWFWSSDSEFGFWISDFSSLQLYNWSHTDYNSVVFPSISSSTLSPSVDLCPCKANLFSCITACIHENTYMGHKSWQGRRNQEVPGGNCPPSKFWQEYKQNIVHFFIKKSTVGELIYTCKIGFSAGSNLHVRIKPDIISRFSQPEHFSRFKPDHLLLNRARFSGDNLLL